VGDVIFTYDFLIPLTVSFVSDLDTNKEYILARNPTNSKEATALYLSLNLPNTFALTELYSG